MQSETSNSDGKMDSVPALIVQIRAVDAENFTNQAPAIQNKLS